MKKIIFLLGLLLLVSFAYAGVIYDIDFSKGPTYIVTLNDGDAVRFNFPVRQYENGNYSTMEEKRNSKYTLANHEQRIVVRKINADKNMIDLTLFIAGAETPQYFTLAEDNVVKVDFERDDINDLIIGLYKLDKNKVELILQKTSLESIDNGSTKKGVLDWINNIDKKQTYYAIAVLIILIVIWKSKRIKEYFASENK